MRNHLIAVLLTLIALMALSILAAFPLAASASGSCNSMGENYVSCSGFTEPVFYSYTCNHVARQWSCTQSLPTYAYWTVDD